MNRMTINYTITTTDHESYKCLICGRTDDLAKLVGHISDGHNIALFGERRIGKTSLLYLVRDVIDGKIDTYRSNLIDDELKAAVKSLRRRLPQYKIIYLDLSAMPESTAEAFVKLLQSKLRAVNLWDSQAESQPFNLLDTFEVINTNLPENSRLVILIDEIEALLEAKGSEQVFRNLRSVMHSCPRIRFVVAGAEYWHKQIKEKTSPLVNNVQSLYLKAATQYAVENYLITEPLEKLLTNDDFGCVAQKIVTWTECKPWYVQAVCQVVVELGSEAKKLPVNWETLAEEEVAQMVGPTLTAFYTGDNLDDVSQRILILLANKPRLTVKEIGKYLGYSEKVVWNKIGDLEALDKVRKQGSEYRITGTLIERWGQKTQNPSISNPWPQRLKWVGLIVALVFAVWVYIYTHPPTQTFLFNFPDGVVTVRMPASLEPNETDIAKVSVQNTSQTQIYSATVSLISLDIEYNENASNQVTFDPINIGEVKHWQPTFTAFSSSGDSFASQILVINNSTGDSAIHPLEIPRRVIPIKAYWGIISVFLTALGTFLVKQDLWEFIKTLLPGLLKSSGKDQ